MDGLVGGAVGWYGDGRRPLLLTQFAEDYFGEPMALLAEGRRVQRVYPDGEAVLRAEDGTRITLRPDSIQLDDAQPLPRAATFVEHPAEFNAGFPLAGTLITPAGPGPHPAAVMVHGSAGGQRDFMRLFAQPLLDAGVAVLIYDKPGHGQSGGPAEPSIFDQARVASAGVHWLRGTAGIDPSRVGCWGFSNGMWAVPMMAAEQDIAFIAGMGSPGLSMANCELHRRGRVLRVAGVGETSVAAAVSAWQAMFGISATGQVSAELRQQLEEALATLAEATDLDRYEVPEFAISQPMLSALPPMIPVPELLAMLEGDKDEELSYDPVDGYRNARCPVFLQYGEEDTSVPADLSAQRIQAASPEARIVIYPGLEHVLNDPGPHAGNEEILYQFHHFSFGEGVREDLSAWLSETL